MRLMQWLTSRYWLRWVVLMLFTVWIVIDWTSTTSRSLLCKIRSEELSSLVWSHRGHVKPYPDASSEATNYLTSIGIHHFDVDVIFVRDDNGADSFYISHPTMFVASNREQHITITDFLDNVFSVVSASAVQVTLEPKWDDQRVFTSFVQLVNDHTFAAKCAIIVRRKSEVLILESYGPKLVVAIPLRSSGIKPGDLWDPIKTEISFWPERSRVILMPDVKLLSLHPTLIDSFEKGVSLVFWIVDDFEILRQVLQRGGGRRISYISNQPELLLELLLKNYQAECKR